MAVNTMVTRKGLCSVCLLTASPWALADAVLPSYEKCLLQQIHQSDANTQVKDIKHYCKQEESKQLLTHQESKAQPKSSSPPPKDKPQDSSVTETVLVSEEEAAVEVGLIEPDSDSSLGPISSRIVHERMTAFDPFVITPHLMNYILPAYASSEINTQAYDSEPEWKEHMEDIEAKFQFSLKVPVNTKSLLVNGDALYFAFTVEAWWQVYADNISKPFRETNYRPEIFYVAPIDFHPFGGNSGLMVGAEHQSNGRSQELSRSWNRLYVAYLYEKDNFALSFRPWYRVSEPLKEFPTDSKGDDNPDILDYMGHFQLNMAYQWDEYNLSLMTRHNFATNKGALELGLTFPLWGKLRGYTRFFEGYGESLIDYNFEQTRFGVGIALTDIM